MKLTRRGILASLPAMALAQQTPAAAEKPAPGQDLETARQAIRSNVAALASVKIPQATEPACAFRVLN